MYSEHHQFRAKNPRHTANLLSFLTFGYTLSLFKKGHRTSLEESDIYAVPKLCSSKRCGDRVANEWKYCKTALQLLFKVFGKKYFLLTGTFLTWNLIISTLYPSALSRFITYFGKNQSYLSRSDAFYNGGLLIVLLIIQCLWLHNYFVLECELGVQIRASLTALLYRKVLTLPCGQIRNSNVGSIVTNLTKDIRTIESTIWPICDVIIGCVKHVYFCYLLYGKIGMFSFVATGPMSFVILAQVLLSKFILTLRLNASKLTDNRLFLTKEVLTILKIIKMYVWEEFFLRRLYQARKKETKASLKSWYLGTTIIAFGTFFGKLIFPLFLLAYISMGLYLDTELVYYLLSLFQDYSFVISVEMPIGFGLAAEFYAAIVRIGRVLSIPEADSKKLKEESKAQLSLNNVSVTIDRVVLLENITFSISQPGLYTIIGPTGSGKSTILKVILNEYSLATGTMENSQNLSYASQDPWLFPATVQQNILFGESFNAERYEKVLEVCCLGHDLQCLPQGDVTVVIDGGLNLSKGQRTRINLARAIYKNSDVYLLDDPLASLDVRVQDEIFTKCIQSFLKDKIVLLVTQNESYLKQSARVICLECGHIKFMKKPEELTSLTEITAQNNDRDSDVNIDTGLNLERDQELKIYQEEKNKGGIDFEIYYNYVKYGGGLLIFAILISLFLGAQFLESYTAKLLSKWVNYEEGTLNSTIINGTQYKNIQLFKNNTFNLYVIISVIFTVIELGKSYWFLVYCRRASIKFHMYMCLSVIKCVITFMDKHFIGNILNRFSYDLDHLDEVFPFLFKDLITASFSCAGTLILILLIDWKFILLTILLFICLAVLRGFYIPTARALKRLGATTRSPFIGHLNATIEGLSTIKAHKAQELVKEEFDRHQDLTTSVVYMEMTTARAFGYALDVCATGFIISIILTFLFSNTDTSVGNVGLALTQVFIMSTNLQRLVRIWANLEQCMTSVERVAEYVKITQENDEGERPLKWPKEGKIEFRNVNLVYNFENKVLKNVSFIINPGERIGIVGRTGTGKSSIISALFRLYEYEGEILIDGIDSKRIALSSLREKISVIPQDPIIFTGTIRENLDPLMKNLDKDIWRVLKLLNLHLVIKNLDQSILNLSFSTGEKQLLCLARVLLKKNQIVIMDEPTANLDSHIEHLVNELFEKHFSNCTFLLVAHKLQSTLNCDKIIVMDNGKIVEFDSPKTLLENPDSMFSHMINTLNA
ncbi:hypothetical protein ABEB36_005737 [Hypothenemus hampei]|uniref:Uncharacterized protein n=1 Tax=Hypothenemus hampei TaxID=57062 RepID=A0ABD1EZ91_HYPHA